MIVPLKHVRFYVMKDTWPFSIFSYSLWNKGNNVFGLIVECSMVGGKWAVLTNCLSKSVGVNALNIRLSSGARWRNIRRFTHDDAIDSISSFININIFISLKIHDILNVDDPNVCCHLLRCWMLPVSASNHLLWCHAHVYKLRF